MATLGTRGWCNAEAKRRHTFKAPLAILDSQKKLSAFRQQLNILRIGATQPCCQAQPHDLYFMHVCHELNA